MPKLHNLELYEQLSSKVLVSESIKHNALYLSYRVLLILIIYK